MPSKEDAEKSDTGAGCALTALGMVAGFAAIEGGILLIAWSLHQILGGAPTLQRAITGGVAGVLLLFAGPQLWFASSRYWPRVTVRQAIAAFPDLALAGWFVLGWAAPQVIGTKAAGMLVGVMVLEFIIIHASIALVAAPKVIAQKAAEGVWWRSERAVSAALLLMYSVAAGGISAAFKTAWLFLAFWLLIANKFIGDWLAPASEAQERLQRHGARWGLSAGLYLLLTAGSVFVPVPGWERSRVPAGRACGSSIPSRR